MTQPLATTISIALGLLLFAACGDDAREETPNPKGGAVCEYIDEAKLCKAGNASCCTLRGHAYEVDTDAGCKKRLDAEEWKRIVCVAQPCVEGAMLTCYMLATEDGGQVIYLGNADVSAAIEQGLLTRCDEETRALVMGGPDC